MPAVRVIVVCLGLLAAAVPAEAEKSILIREFAADVRVNADGSIGVTETITAQFTGSWNGLYRTIPIVYRTPQGFDYELRLDVQSVHDEGGQSLKYESSRERHYRKLKIWVPGAADATRTVSIAYQVSNGLKFFDEHDELYWNVTGDEWDVPIAHARATLHLPPAASGVRTAAFTGGYGSQESAVRVTTSGADVEVESTRLLNFREGLTVAVAWNPGAVARPTSARKAADFIAANVVLLVPVAALGIMFNLWSRHGRDPRRQPIAVQYEPPGSLTPAELGTLVDHSPDLRDITATMVDLAVRGYLLIREEKEDRLLGLGSRTDYGLTPTRPRDAWKELRPHEEALLSALFDGAQSEVRISDLRNRFYKSLPGIRDRILDRLVAQGYYTRRPDKVSAVYAVVAAVVGIGGAAASLWLDLGVAPIVAALLTGIVVGVFGHLMPARTVAGARVLERGLGFEEFLDRVEGDNLQRVARSPEMFERFLPFAMAFGVERNWARAFEGIYTSPPGWYAGGTPGTFSPRVFAASLGDLSKDAGSAMTSSPRSSGGSGFSGGGSGGGFGGGGGGGF